MSELGSRAGLGLSFSDLLFGPGPALRAEVLVLGLVDSHLWYVCWRRAGEVLVSAPENKLRDFSHVDMNSVLICEICFGS